MTMKSVPIISGGRVIGRACYRERARNCYSCRRAGAELTCDGCDHVLCASCSVAPREGLDFCPGCFMPAFEKWKAGLDGAVPIDREHRRELFRTWARQHAEEFLSLSKQRTKKSLQEVP